MTTPPPRSQSAYLDTQGENPTVQVRPHPVQIVGSNLIDVTIHRKIGDHWDTEVVTITRYEARKLRNRLNGLIGP